MRGMGRRPTAGCGSSGGSTLGQEGSDDPLEGWKLGKGVHGSPLGQHLEAPLYAHNVLDEMPCAAALRLAPPLFPSFQNFYTKPPWLHNPGSATVREGGAAAGMA
ncbi:hypothetical protein L3X38_012317 [Prunus dulcis]|uniref:Uncharacterized protein n=1 Tax=Prunus dulcis TaxID=3755 RepID=A0AAD4ZFW8_PRUDU|nr:hypothetical protein L3X38_012317 [Prunus dulcis]